jgi:hypothetical protein
VNLPKPLEVAVVGVVEAPKIELVGWGCPNALVLVLPKATRNAFDHKTKHFMVG